MSKNWLTVSIVVLFMVVVCGACLVVAAGAGYFFVNENAVTLVAETTSTPVVIRPTGETNPQVTATPILTPIPDVEATDAPVDSVLPDSAADTLETLKNTIIPSNDLVDLAQRLEGKRDIPPTLEPPAVPFKVGDEKKFWVSNADTNENFEVTATLRYETDHTYFWIQNGVSYDADELQALAETFENKIYLTNREFFGSEWTPGIDGDPHLYILYARNLGRGVAGYFSSIDSYNPLVQEYSNGHEMFVFNADNTDFGEEYTYGVLAHEFQHMIHWYRDRNETRWMNEGFSDLAMLLNGYGIGGHDYLYVMEPDLQLNDWPTDQTESAPYYGAAFLYLTYFLDRFGEEATQALVGDAENGLDSVDNVLSQIAAVDAVTGEAISADDLFVDWTIANFLKDERVGDGRYTYNNYSSAPQTGKTESINSCPTEWLTRDVRQYGVDYIHIECDGDYTLSFEGSIQVGVVPVQPYSGSYAFWSNKGDESDLTLTQTFDFSEQSGPLTLEYWTWYDLEEDFDYLYLVASTDGENWDILKTPSGTSEDPTGANYGWGYNGQSGRGNSPQWIQESVDISEFAGQQVQLRFEYVTDASVNGEGFLLDDIAIPETGYFSDFEEDEGGWETAGFVRIQNQLPQTFRLALITFGESTQVEYIDIAADNSAEVPLNFTGTVEEAVLVVSGNTRFTRQPAAYRFQITP